MLSLDRNIQIGRAVADLVRTDLVKARLVEVAQEAKAILSADTSKLAASVGLPLELFGSSLPSELKSCRLSVMRGGTTYHIERHPNATQYVLSIDGEGSIRVKSADKWAVSRLSSDPAASILERWHTVPANTWHQPIPSDNDWTVVAFHTAAAGEFKDEYGYNE
jgi:hypothetical protein